MEEKFDLKDDPFLCDECKILGYCKKEVNPSIESEVVYRKTDLSKLITNLETYLTLPNLAVIQNKSIEEAYKLAINSIFELDYKSAYDNLIFIEDEGIIYDDVFLGLAICNLHFGNIEKAISYLYKTHYFEVEEWINELDTYNIERL